MDTARNSERVGVGRGERDRHGQREVLWCCVCRGNRQVQCKGLGMSNSSVDRWGAAGVRSGDKGRDTTSAA